MDLITLNTINNIFKVVSKYFDEFVIEMEYLDTIGEFYGIPGVAVVAISVSLMAITIIALVASLKLHCYQWERKLRDAEFQHKLELAERKLREKNQSESLPTKKVAKSNEKKPRSKPKSPVKKSTSKKATVPSIRQPTTVREMTDNQGPCFQNAVSIKTLNPVFAHGSREWNFFYEIDPKHKRMFEWKGLPTTLKLPTHMWSLLPYKTDRPIDLRCSKFDSDDVNSTVFMTTRPLVRDCWRPFLKFGMRLSEPFDYSTLPTAVLTNKMSVKLESFRAPYYILKVFIFRTDTPCFEIHYQGPTPLFLHKIPRCPECKTLDSSKPPTPWSDIGKLSQKLRAMPSGHHFHGSIAVPPRLSAVSQANQIVNIFAYHGAPACIAVEPSENTEYHVNRQNVAFKQSELNFRGTKNAAGYSTTSSQSRAFHQSTRSETASTASTKR